MFDQPAAAAAFGLWTKAQADRGPWHRSDARTESKTALVDALRKL